MEREKKTICGKSSHSKVEKNSNVSFKSTSESHSIFNLVKLNIANTFTEVPSYFDVFDLI